MRRAPWIVALPLVLLAFQDPGRDEDETELSQHMHRIEKHVKSLRKLLRDETGRDGALAELAQLEQEALQCKGLAPETAAALPENERAAFLSAYRRTMVDFLTTQLALEAALLDGDAAATKQSFEKLRAMEDSSHERFAPDAEEH